MINKNCCEWRFPFGCQSAHVRKPPALRVSLPKAKAKAKSQICWSGQSNMICSKLSMASRNRICKGRKWLGFEGSWCLWSCLSVRLMLLYLFLQHCASKGPQWLVCSKQFLLSVWALVNKCCSQPERAVKLELTGSKGKGNEKFINSDFQWPIKMTAKDVAVKGRLLVCNIGDSISWMRWKHVHPCLLPKKKYVYLNETMAFVNPGASFLFALQGIGRMEQRHFGWDSHLTYAQSQDLCGNAFTSNVVASVLLSALVHVMEPVLQWSGGKGIKKIASWEQWVFSVLFICCRLNPHMSCFPSRVGIPTLD